jgi:hypothetical protein
MNQENTGASTVLQIPPDIDALGTALFIQQMGLWGQDTKRPEGNLFLEYGFTRERPPAGAEGDTSYLLHLDSKKSLVLWRFGLFYLDTQIGGILLKRRNFIPKLTSLLSIPTNRWQLTDIPSATPPSTVTEVRQAFTLLSAALLWISDYEKWVKSTLGEAYRLDCLEKQNEAIIPAQGFDAEWKRLAMFCLNLVGDRNGLEAELAG